MDKLDLLGTLEAAPGHPYWWEGADWPELTEGTPSNADLLVIGAGYTGLAAAIAAHDCGAKVVVVDAAKPGQGASTRNGGMFGAHPRLTWDKLAKLYGPDTATGVFAEAHESLDFVKDLIAREGISCDFQETGRVSLAWTKAHAEGQRRLVSRVTEHSRVPVRLVDRNDLGQEISTPQYHGGIVFEGHGGLHPRKYHDGLLSAVLRRGIGVHGDCKVERYARRGGGFEVSTVKGSLTAGKIVLATNGYTQGPFRWHQARVFALPSYVIATEPVAPNLLGHLAPGRRMMVETRARHSYFRLSPDGTRILFGGRAAMRPVPLDTAASRLHGTMTQIWPELAGTRLSHVWTGNTGYSFTHMPHVGEVDGIHYAMGFSGSGTVMAPYLGSKAGFRAVGDPRGDTAYANTSLKRHPLHPTRAPHFLHAADLWYRHWVDRQENRAARRM